jgi:hypothetical protein
LDRRVFTRIQIPGAKIKYKKNGLSSLLSSLSKPVEIMNLSKSGICFPIDETLKYGDPVIMKIQFPDGRNLNLKGQVRWHNLQHSSSSYHAGIQFSPFGSQSNYNPIEALEYLRSMDGLSIMKQEKEQN